MTAHLDINTENIPQVDARKVDKVNVENGNEDTFDNKFLRKLKKMRDASKNHRREQRSELAHVSRRIKGAGLKPKKKHEVSEYLLKPSIIFVTQSDEGLPSSNDLDNEPKNENESLSTSPPAPTVFETVFGREAKGIDESATKRQRIRRIKSRKLNRRRLTEDEVVDALIKYLVRSLDTWEVQNDLFDADSDEEDIAEINFPQLREGLKQAISAFKDSYNLPYCDASPEEIAEIFLTPSFCYKLINNLRFEDDRTPSAKLQVLHSVYKACPALRKTFPKAITNAAAEHVTEHAKRDFISCDEEQETTSLPPSQSSRLSKSQPSCIIELLAFILGFLTVCNVALGDDTQYGFAEDMDFCLEEEGVHDICRALLMLSQTTTDNMLLDVICKFLLMFPSASYYFVTRFFRQSNNLDHEKQVFSMRLSSAFLLELASPRNSYLQSRMQDTVSHILTEVTNHLTSPNSLVARQAIQVFESRRVISNFLSPCWAIYSTVRQSLLCNRRHWDKSVCQRSDLLFDILLDYC